MIPFKSVRAAKLWLTKNHARVAVSVLITEQNAFGQTIINTAEFKIN